MVRSENSTRCRATKFSTGFGLHSLTAVSMPLVANRHVVGCGWTQLTMFASPRYTSEMRLVERSQM